MPVVTLNGGEKPGVMVASVGDEQIIIDRSEGGGPGSIDFVLVGLGACTYATVGFYMDRKGLTMDGFSVQLSADRDKESGLYEEISVKLSVSDEIPDKQKVVIRNTAKTCRIHRTLNHKPEIIIDME